MNEELKTGLFILLALAIMGGLMRSAWRLLKRSESMLDEVDQSKLREWKDDKWGD